MIMKTKYTLETRKSFIKLIEKLIVTPNNVTSLIFLDVELGVEEINLLTKFLTCDNFRVKKIKLWGNIQITQILEMLIATPNNITNLKIVCVKLEPIEANLLAKFLVCNNCMIKNLKLTYTGIAKNGYNCIADAMAHNKSIEKLNIEEHLYFTCNITLDEFVRHLAIAIHNHPCIKYLYLPDNNITSSLKDLVVNMPKSLKHLGLINNDYINEDHFKLLLKHTKLESIDITCMNRIQDNIEPYLEANRYIFKFDHICHLPYNIRPSVKNAILNMLTRNTLAKRSANSAAMALISIRKFRRNICGLLGWMPKEIVSYIAQLISESYVDDEWRQNLGNKRIKLSEYHPLVRDY